MGVDFTVINTAELKKLRSLDQAKQICEANGYAVVPVEDCDSCGNTGKLSMGYMSGSCGCHCRSNPASRFNQNKAMLEAAREKQ
jgi:hypothetical protein